MTVLEVVGLTVAFNERRVLSDVSVTVGSGEALGVIGPNGAGKTTLIDAITGFVPYAGAVLIDGEPIDGLAPHRRASRGLARTFQRIELFDDLTVRENAAVSPWSTKASVEAALVATGLSGEAEQPARSLPRPARQLVGLARALGSSPRVVLLDEIAAGTDAAERSALVGLLSDVLASGIALVVVDHELAFVESLCRCVLALAELQL